MSVQSIMRHVMDMLPYILISLPFIAIFRGVRIYCISKKEERTTFLREAAMLLFLLFMVGLFSQTVIPRIEITANGIGIVKNGESGVNFIPFKIFADSVREFNAGNRSYFVINLLGNIGMFVPIGIFTALLWRKIGFGKAVLIAFAVSLFIELCQLPQSRWTDIDDLWMNTLGGAVGYDLYRLLGMAFPKLPDKFKVRKKVQI